MLKILLDVKKTGEDTNKTVKRVLEHVETSSIADLRECAYFFEDAPAAEATRFDLMTFLKAKSEDIQRLLKEREQLPSSLPRLQNVRAQVTEDIENYRLQEAESLLDGAREILKTETVRPVLEENAKLDEQKAEILLIRGRVDDAYTILSAAADSFAIVDALEPARRRITYENRLYAHGHRYGGQGMALSEAMLRKAIDDLAGTDHAELWASAQNNIGNALQEQGKRTADLASNTLLADAVTAYRAALTIRTKADHPVEWATTQNNLAATELSIAGHDNTIDPCTNLEAAIAHVDAALTIFDPDHMNHVHGTATWLRDRILSRFQDLS